MDNNINDINDDNDVENLDEMNGEEWNCLEIKKIFSFFGCSGDISDFNFVNGLFLESKTGNNRSAANKTRCEK